MAGVAILSGGLGMVRHPAIGGLFVVLGIGFLWAHLRSRERMTQSLAHKLASHQAIFEQLHAGQTELDEHIKHLQELWQTEKSDAPSPRSEQRIELLAAAVQNRQRKAALIATELWARDIQLWLNQLEGFLSEKLAMLNRQNGALLLGEFRILILAGRQLLTRADQVPEDSLLGQQARRLLAECLAKAPEFEDRVRDARVLAAVGEGPELPAELTEGTTWLHWIQNTIPPLNLLPEVLTVDEEYQRMNTELRLIRDGAKFASCGPVIPSTTPAAILASHTLDSPL